MRSPSAAYMVRQGRFKYHYYVRFDAELYDLQDDPEETRNLADNPAYATVTAEYEAKLRAILDPEAMDAEAKSDQKALVERHGGPEVVFNRSTGGKNFTEIPAEIEAVL